VGPFLLSAICKTPTSERQISPHLQVLDTFLCVPVLIVFGRAALVMDGMTWKGRKTSSEQALSWPRREVHLDGENKAANYLPARIQYGQMALAAEIHADDIDPIDKRKGAVTLERVEGAVTREYATIPNTSKRLLPAAPDRPSATQFADYLLQRGLFSVKV